MLDAFVIPTFIGPIAVAQIPKCGSQTLHKYASQTMRVCDLYQFPLRIAFIREPFDKFLSAFHFMTNTCYRLDGQVIKSYEYFVDLALVTSDEHVRPQGSMIDLSVFTTIMELDSMSEVLGKLMDTVIEKENQAARHDVDTSYRKAEVMKMYREDAALYNSCGVA